MRTANVQAPKLTPACWCKQASGRHLTRERQGGDVEKSTDTAARRKAAGKPKKPRSDFPLFPHASGKWAKTILGKSYYFGKWEDPDGAEQEFLEVAKDLHAGRETKPKGSPRSNGRHTFADAWNAVLTDRRAKLDAGALSPRTLVDYDRTCRLLVEAFGRQRSVEEVGPQDFQRLYTKLSAGRSLSSPAGHIAQTRMVFRFAEESDLIEKRVKFGPSFTPPNKSAERKAKAKQKAKSGSRTFEPKQIREMLDAASPQLKAMLLLGINCGFGDTDCASLPLSAVDLEKGWIDFPRPKTGRRRPSQDPAARSLPGKWASRYSRNTPAQLISSNRCRFGPRCSHGSNS